MYGELEPLSPILSAELLHRKVFMDHYNQEADSILDGPDGFARPAYYMLLHFLVSVSGFHVQPTKLLWAVGKFNLF
jgi:hypothetical protein